MKVLIFGATGPTGRQLVRLSEAGHTVSAFVRNVGKANFSPNVRVIVGDAFDSESVAAAVPGHDAVLSCLGAPLGQSFGALGRPGAVAIGSIIKAMEASRARRLVVLSAMGAVDRGAVTPLFRIATATLLRGIFADKDAMEPQVSASGLSWTIIRAANLSNAEEGPVDDQPQLPLGMTSFVPRASVASYMLGTLEQPASIRRVIFLTAKK